VAVTAWVVVVIPALLLQLVILLIQLPRILGTAWDSFGHLLSQAGHAASPIAATTAVIEMVALALPILGILLMLVRLGQRSGQWVWTKTEGRPVQRTLAVVLLLGAAGLLLYLWIPKGNYTPINRREKGTITQGVLAINPRNIAHLRSLRPPPDLSSHDPTATTIAPTPTTTTPRYTTETTSRYTTETTSRYTTPTTG